MTDFNHEPKRWSNRCSTRKAASLSHYSHPMPHLFRPIWLSIANLKNIETWHTTRRTISTGIHLCNKNLKISTIASCSPLQRRRVWPTDPLTCRTKIVNTQTAPMCSTLAKRKVRSSFLITFSLSLGLKFSIKRRSSTSNSVLWEKTSLQMHHQIAKFKTPWCSYKYHSLTHSDPKRMVPSLSWTSPISIQSGFLPLRALLRPAIRARAIRRRRCKSLEKIICSGQARKSLVTIVSRTRAKTTLTWLNHLTKSRSVCPSKSQRRAHPMPTPMRQ